MTVHESTRRWGQSGRSGSVGASPGRCANGLAAAHIGPRRGSRRGTMATPFGRPAGCPARNVGQPQVKLHAPRLLVFFYARADPQLQVGLGCGSPSTAILTAPHKKMDNRALPISQ